MKDPKTEKKHVRCAKTVALCLLLSLLLAAFSACTGKENDETQLKTAEEMAAFVEENGEFPPLEDVDKATAEEIYGVDSSRVKSCVIRTSSDRLLADEIFVAELSDPDYAETLEGHLRSRLAGVARAAENYSPEQYSYINGAEVVRRGSFVFYIVNRNGEALTRQLSALIPN